MQFIGIINDFLWGVPLTAGLVAAGLYFSAGTKFFQLRRLPHWLKATAFAKRESKKDKHTVTAFQAACSALAATLGTGNITGVSAAIAMGGAGAVFWMWISALLGMMTGYAENLLGHIFRRRDINGEWQGGAMCYIEGGLSQHKITKPAAKSLACIFAGLCVLCSFGMGNMAQMNSAATALKADFGIPPIISGLVLAGCAAAAIFGGIKRIAAITERIVPLMSCFYILGAVWIIIANIGAMPSVFGMIFEGAFGLNAVSGGVSGYIIKQAVSAGLRRGVFSNEAGLGSSPSAHAASSVTDPVIQGMWGILEVFFDTIIMCSLTAVILLGSSCNAPPLSEVSRSVTLSPQYFRLTDSDRIITGGTPLLISGEDIILPCESSGSTKFTLSLAEGELTFSNLMTIRGVQSVDEDGQPIFLGRGKNLPLIESAVIEEVNGSALATYAFSRTFGSGAGKILAVAVVLFAFSTVLGWSCFGLSAAKYLFGDRCTLLYRLMFIGTAILGACMDFSAVWGLCDLINGLMAIPNLFALFLLSPTVFRKTREYEKTLHQK